MLDIYIYMYIYVESMLEESLDDNPQCETPGMPLAKVDHSWKLLENQRPELLFFCEVHVNHSTDVTLGSFGLTNPNHVSLASAVRAK